MSRQGVFYCPEHRLIIEVDGPIHKEQQSRDAVRQQVLADRGYRVARLTGDEVEQDIGTAIERIRYALAGDTTPPTSPLPLRERGWG